VHAQPMGQGARAPSETLGIFCHKSLEFHVSSRPTTVPGMLNVSPVTVCPARNNILAAPLAPVYSLCISASEMTYIVSSGALNSTHSLTHSLCIETIYTAVLQATVGNRNDQI